MRRFQRDRIPTPELVCLYLGGWTQAQLAALYEVGSSTIQRVFGDLGIPSRGRGSGSGSAGSAHYRWKGQSVNYKNAHKRVFRARGKATSCVKCGQSTPELKYEWANLIGNFHDVWDYESLCAPCHRKFDAERRAS